MPLIECPDCKKQISDIAPACPHCGRPRVQAVPQQEQIVTIQQSSKLWKALILLSIVGFFASLTVQPPGNGPLLGAGSIVLFFVAVIGKWWHHG